MRRTGRNLRPLGRGGCQLNKLLNDEFIIEYNKLRSYILPEKRTIEDLNIVSNNYSDIIKLKSMHNETNHTNTIN